jgi:outer membrane protein OmpA-like peptidoglycan-associated protein
MPRTVITTAVLVAVVGFAGCESTGGVRQETAVGAGIGAVAGGILGKQAGGRAGMVGGAVLGGMLGGAVGSHLANQREALERDLAEEIAAGQASVSQVTDETSGAEMIRIQLDGTATFDTGSATPRPESVPTIQRIADAARAQGQSVVHVIGHTDITGSVEGNVALSKRRAESVAAELVRRGVDDRYVLADGRGPFEPIASNATDAGRAKNRRVDIYLRPIVAGREAEAFESPRPRG